MAQASDMDRRITCLQCQNQFPTTWISTMIHCPFCQASVVITRSDYLSNEQRICYRVTKNEVPIAADSSGNMKNTYDHIPFSKLRPYWTLSPMTSVIVRPKQRAVLCGVAYSKRRKYKLKGTVADVRNMKELLMRRFHFPEEGIRVLTGDLQISMHRREDELLLEEGNDDSVFPTKKNIQDSLHWLVHDCQYGDSLVFFFSGHGVRQPEFDGDERDGFDETICPVDFMEQGMILDNDINAIIVRPLTPGVTLHAIVDACHSGTILDLPFLYNPHSHSQLNKWEDDRLVAYKGTRGGLAISLSACRDNEMAADTSAFEGNTMNGAMTYTFTKLINENPNITYAQLLTRIHQEITKANEVHCLNSRRLARIFHKKISQEPLLSSSMEFNVNRTQFSFYPVLDILLP